MVCPKCKFGTRVIDSSVNKVENEIYRKHGCAACGHTFYTVEYEVIYNKKFQENWKKHYRRQK